MSLRTFLRVSLMLPLTAGSLMLNLCMETYDDARHLTITPQLEKLEKETANKLFDEAISENEIINAPRKLKSF